MKMSGIHLRLQLYTLSIAAVVTGGLTLYGYLHHAERILDGMHATARSLVQELARGLQQERVDAGQLTLQLKAIRSVPDVVAAAALSDAGAPLVGGDSALEPFDRQRLADAALAGAPLVWVRGDRVHALLAVEDAVRGRPARFAYVAMSLERAHEEQRDDLQVAVLLALLALALSLPLAYGLAHSFATPVRELAAAAHAVRAGQMDTRVTTRRDDELGVLYAAFNEMMEALARSSSEEQAARRAAEAASAAKSQFLATMSHEIRTPMNGVLATTDLLLQSNLTPGQRAYAQIVASSGRALLSIINDILDFSKIEAGRLDLQRADFDLHEMVQEVASLLEPHAAAKGLPLKHRIAHDVPRWVQGDAGRLRQVLLNLAGNGIKFTDRGSVTIDVGTIPTQGEPLLRFAVHDTGIGIAAADAARLFQPFSQLDGSAARRFGGTGLGLAISQQLVTLMGGRIDVHSEPHRGSTFSFALALPAVAAPERPAPAPLPSPTLPQAAMPATSLRVLLAEDNLVNQQLALAMLETHGHQAIVAGNGHEVLQALERETVDLVLMDCQMPDMDGYEATREIRRREREQGRPRLPIIALTANALSGDRERCLAAGMDDYVSKPFTTAELMEALHRRFAPALPKAA